VETLSGGEMQRAVLARAVAQEASLLVLDEPTSALDIASQVEVISYLAELQRAYQLTVIVALHDLNLAINYAQSVILLKDGRVLGSGDTLKIMNSEKLSEAYKSQIEVTSLVDGNKMVLVKYNL
jgi:iron complex transport system ATP-binding protein